MSDEPGGQPAQAGRASHARRAIGPSIVRGLACALVAAAAGIAVWFALAVATDRQVSFLAVLLGMAVGQALVWGSGRRGWPTAVAAVAIAGAALLVGYYWIDRHMIITGGEAIRISYSVPVVPSPQGMYTVLRLGFRNSRIQFLFTTLGVLAAGYFGYGQVSAADGTAGG